MWTPSLYHFRVIGGGVSISGTVATYANLPAASAYTNKFYRVTTASGTIFVDRKPAGVYVSDGSTWVYVADFTEHDQASEISNDSGVSGATVADALDTLDSGVASLVDAGIQFIINGGGSTITTGVKGYVQIPYDCTITANRLLADQTGSIVVDIWKDTYANYPPDNSDSITASAPPTISSAIKSQDATLTGWTTSISAGDILGYNVDSVTGIQFVTLMLDVTRI